MSEFKDYTVEWHFAVGDAISPKSAAEQAWDAMQRGGSIANVFSVRADDSPDMVITVDLHEDFVDEPAWVPSNEALAELAAYMAEEQWDVSEIVEMIRRPRKYADVYSQMVRDRAFDAVAKEDEQLDEEDRFGSAPSDIWVHFTPEVWVNDYAVEATVDWDQFEWNVSDVNAICIEEQLADGKPDWDWLKDEPEALAWCRDWKGPFTIEILARDHAFETENGRTCRRCGNLEFDHGEI